MLFRRKIQRSCAYCLYSTKLDEETLAPSRVELTGVAGPYARRALEGFLQDSLGISREDQIWIP